MFASEIGEGECAGGGLVVDGLAVDRDSVVCDGGCVGVDDKVGGVCWLCVLGVGGAGGGQCEERKTRKKGVYAACGVGGHGDRVKAIGGSRKRWVFSGKNRGCSPTVVDYE